MGEGENMEQTRRQFLGLLAGSTAAVAGCLDGCDGYREAPVSETRAPDTDYCHRPVDPDDDEYILSDTDNGNVSALYNISIDDDSYTSSSE